MKCTTCNTIMAKKENLFLCKKCNTVSSFNTKESAIFNKLRNNELEHLINQL